MLGPYRAAVAVVWAALALICAGALGEALAEVDGLYLLMIPGGLALVALGAVGLARADLRAAGGVAAGMA